MMPVPENLQEELERNEQMQPYLCFALLKAGTDYSSLSTLPTHTLIFAVYWFTLLDLAYQYLKTVSAPFVTPLWNDFVLELRPSGKGPSLLVKKKTSHRISFDFYQVRLPHLATPASAYAAFNALLPFPVTVESLLKVVKALEAIKGRLAAVIEHTKQVRRDLSCQCW